MRDERFEAQSASLVVVEPDQLAADLRVQRAVHGDEESLDAGLQRQPRQEMEGIGTESCPRPRNRPSSSVAESFGRDLPSDSSIVIAGDTERVEFPKQRNAFVRARVVANDVPETN